MQSPDIEVQSEAGVAAPATGSVRAHLLRGLTWAAGYQAFELVVAFGAMLITVRLIPPGEYGRAAVTVGFLAALNTVSCGLFVSHALQLPDAVEPDWTRHLSAAIYIHGALFIICEAAATLAWFSHVYRSVAPLLHVAGIGLLIAAPNQVAITKLYRELDFRRLKTLSAVCTASKLAVTIGVALSGHGALAIIGGNNVVSCTPFAFDLLIVRRWRPAPGWWRGPDWHAYRDPLHFGFQRLGAVLAGGARDAIEAAVLPGALGFGIIGLVGRANGLYSATVGRLESIIVDTVYPFLPRVSGDRERYARRATLLVQAALVMTVPATVFIAFEGPSLSRVLYGRKWIDADPMILPATVAGLALTLSSVASMVLLGAGRVRRSLQIDATTSAFTAAAVVGAVIGRGALPYLWALAAGNVVATVAAAAVAAPLLSRGWLRRSVLPATVSCGTAALALWAMHARLPARPLWHVVTAGIAFLTCAFATLRFLFAGVLTSLVDDLSWNWARRLLRLPAPVRSEVAAA